jgi:hypothetical protein
MVGPAGPLRDAAAVSAICPSVLDDGPGQANRERTAHNTHCRSAADGEPCASGAPLGARCRAQEPARPLPPRRGRESLATVIALSNSAMAPRTSQARADAPHNGSPSDVDRRSRYERRSPFSDPALEAPRQESSGSRAGEGTPRHERAHTPASSRASIIASVDHVAPDFLYRSHRGSRPC